MKTQLCSSNASLRRVCGLTCHSLLFLLCVGLGAGGARAATSGAVIAWGLNDSDQTTVPVAAQSGVAAIAAGGSHNVALRNDGGVIAWGWNDDGQAAVPAAAQSGVIAIAAGNWHTVALKNDGRVIAWGNNGWGQTDVPEVAQSGVMTIAAGGGHTLALKNDGSVIAWGWNDDGQTTVPLGAQTGVVAIAAGELHSAALKHDGSVVVWGYNGLGQTDVPEAAQSGVTAISAGSGHTMALKNHGGVVAWGNGGDGLSEIPLAVQSGVTAIAAGWFHNLALKNDGSLVAWGYNEYGQTTVPIAAQSGVVAVAAGYSHSVALVTPSSPAILTQPMSQIVDAGLTASFTVWTAGYPLYYQWRKDGTNIPGATGATYILTDVQPNQAGAYTVVVSNLVGSVTSSPPAMLTINTAAPAILVQPVSQTVNLGQSASVVVVATGAPLYYQWYKDGVRLDGATGATCSLGLVRTNQAGSYIVVVSNFLGSVTSAAPAVITVNVPAPGAVVAWGRDFSGQTTVPPAAQSGVMAIAAGNEHTVALDTNGTVLAWGENRFGQTTVPVIAQSGVTAVAAGIRHTVVLKDDGSVLAWGQNFSGQTTIPEAAQAGVTAIAAGAYHTVALKDDGRVVAWGYSDFGQTTVPVVAQSGVAAIAAGEYHTVALKRDGSVVAWGDNSSGQSAVPLAAQSGVLAIAAAGNHTAALQQNGNVLVWGGNDNGQTNLPVDVRIGVMAIAVGYNHVAALKTNGSVVVWGFEGDGATTVPTVARRGATAVAAGGEFIVALVNSIIPSITSQPVSQTVNAGQNASFSVAATGVYVTYQWRKDGTNLAGATGPTYNLSQVQPQHAGGYTVVISNFTGSVTSAPAMLTVLAAPPSGSISFSSGMSPALAGSNVRFCATISGTPTPTHQWQFNGDDLPGENKRCLNLLGVSSNQAGSYRVVASNSVGVFTSMPIELVVEYLAPAGSIFPVGVLSPTPADSTLGICSTIRGGPPPDYQWQFNGVDLPGQTAPCLSISEVQTNQSGEYRLVASNFLGSFTSAVAVVSVVYAPPAAAIHLASGHTPTTVGETLILCVSVRGGPRPTVQWQFNGTNLPGRTDSCLYLSNLETNQSGSYSVVASNILGVVTSAVVAVSVIEPVPVLAYFGSGFPPFEVGSYSTLCADTSLSEPLMFQWRFNGIDLPESTNFCHYVWPLQAGDAGDYSVVVTSVSGVYTSPPIALTVYYAPPTEAQPGFSSGGPSSLVGEDVILNASYLGSPSFVQWRYNGVDLPQQTNRSLALLPVATHHAGEYSFTATNIAGATTSSVVIVSVSYQTPVFVTHPSSQSVVEGTTARFTMNARGGPPPEYFLEQNGTNVAVPFTYAADYYGSNGFSLLDATLADAGGYRVIASNSLGSATSMVATLTVTPAGPLDRWTQRNPLPQSQPLLAVAHGANQFVAVGERGTILTSPDGSNWSLQNRRADVSLNGVAYGGGLFVAVGAGGTILSSPDGTNWAYRYTAAGTFLNAVTHADGRFVAVGSAPALSTLFLHSTDGIHWERISVDGFYAQQCVAHGDGRFIAGGSDSILVSTDGTNWALARSVNRQVESLAYGDGSYVAVGDDGSILVSPDAVSWVARQPVSTRRLLGLTYGAGRFVAVGARGNVLTSTDTIVWTSVPSGTPDRLEAIAFSGDGFVATGENGTVVTSTDGATWTTQNFGTTRDLDGMHGANGAIVIVGKGGSILTSTDGVHFAMQPSGVANDLHGVTWGGGLWVAVGEPGIILSSSNRVDWIAHDAGTTNSLKHVTYAEGQWIVVGTEGTVVRSTDGVNWTATFTSPPFDLNAVAYGNGMFLIAGDGANNQNGSIFLSLDGISWTQVNYYPGKNMRGIAFAHELFLITANDGVVFTTTDGLNFNSNFLGGGNLRAATWIEGLWIVVGNNGAINTSPDLVTWTRRASRIFENQHQVALLDGRLVVIGNRGGVLQSGRFFTELEPPVYSFGTGFQLPFKGVLNQTYQLQASTNLVNWTSLLTFTNLSEYGKISDPHEAQHSQRFYRLVTP